MLKVITVCGLGVGSSLIMKMTATSAMKRLGVKSQIEHWDMGTVGSKPCDLIVTSEEFKKNFADQDNVVYVNNFVDVDEMTEKLDDWLTTHGLKEG